ncbi:hypothetical protein BDR07DRAFT_1427132 [Suillus spraguei]|nr:hypothetical protein BDR07DRAFT_1427132 [Suillus spraguei]
MRTAIPITSRPLDLIYFAFFPALYPPSLTHSKHFVWFKTFLAIEALFQLPVFVLGARGLWRDARSIYVLLLVYGASTTTTTLPAQTITDQVISVTSSQRLLLLSSYIPFFVIPLVMTVDMASRLSKLVTTGIDAADDKKSS